MLSFFVSICAFFGSKSALCLVRDTNPEAGIEGSLETPLLHGGDWEGADRLGRRAGLRAEHTAHRSTFGPLFFVQFLHVHPCGCASVRGCTTCFVGAHPHSLQNLAVEGS